MPTYTPYMFKVVFDGQWKLSLFNLFLDNPLLKSEIKTFENIFNS